jgi:hypothetical protein
MTRSSLLLIIHITQDPDGTFLKVFRAAMSTDIAWFFLFVAILLMA